jgi:hypothetical protein
VLQARQAVTSSSEMEEIIRVRRITPTWPPPSDRWPLQPILTPLLDHQPVTAWHRTASDTWVRIADTWFES